MANSTKRIYHGKLAKCYYATATIDESTGAVTYDTPVRLKNAVSITLTPKGGLMSTNADGGIAVLGAEYTGFEGDLELVKVPEDFETACLGETKNTDGTIDEFVNDNAKPFALLFELTSNAKAIRHCVYLCYASKNATEGDNPEKTEIKNDKLSITAIPRPSDGKVKTKTGDSTTDTVYDAWYSAVPDQTASA